MNEQDLKFMRACIAVISFGQDMVEAVNDMAVLMGMVAHRRFFSDENIKDWYGSCKQSPDQPQPAIGDSGGSSTEAQRSLLTSIGRARQLQSDGGRVGT